MTNPLWPDPSKLPFPFLGKAGETASTMPPLTQGLAGGMELIKKFWGALPGGTALPGFLVPTVDVEELDKRLSDLRAAESWLEVNLNMLRATIQGLEVQRNTIAAIQSLSAMAEGALAGKGPSPSASTASSPSEPSSTGLPPGWPTPPAPAEPPSATPPAASPAAVPSETPSAETSAVAGTPDPVVGLAANNWLGFMQDQFMKVAQAAIAPVRPGAPAPSKKAAKKRTSRSTTAPSGKPVRRRASAPR